MKKVLILLIIFISFSIANNITTLKSAETKFGIANEHEYSYYKINALKGDVVTVKLYDMDADGDLYVNIGSIATKDKWKYKSIHTRLHDEEVTFTLQNDDTVYISVYAYKCIATVEHKIVVNINREEKNSIKVFPSNPSPLDKFVTYTPSGGITSSTPVVLFLNGSKQTLDKYEGFMYFLAQEGYFVIGAYSNNYNPKFSRDIFTEVIATTKEHSDLTLNKLAVVGHSLGGGNSFFVMKHFQDLGYAKDGSLTLSIEGWFPFAMKKDDFKSIHGNVAFLQMNGKVGTDDVDVLINLTAWNLLKNSQRFFLSVLENDHLYIEGDRENFLKKHELVEIISKLMKDAFNKSSDGYDSIPSQYKASYQDIYNKIENVNDRSVCSGKLGNAISILDSLGNDIDYCHPEKY